LLREAVIQEAKERQEKLDRAHEEGMPKSAPAATETAYGHPITKSSKLSEGGSAVGVIRKLRSNKQNQGKDRERDKEREKDRGDRGEKERNQSQSNSFDVTVDSEVDSKKNAINFDELVANFQNGTTLKKLQRELEISKQSMQRSEAFLKSLSMEYLNKL
jgi:hypothetical protein